MKNDVLTPDLLDELADLRDRVAALETLEQERARIEAELRGREERYRSLLERVPEAIFILTDDGDWKFLYANEASARLFGADSASEMLGKPLLEFVHLEARDTVAAQFRQMSREGKAYYGSQGQLTRRDGTVVDFEASTLAVYARGIPTRQVVMRDITERKRIEEKLFQFQKMEALGSLAGGIAHDFNNLLTAILGYTQLGLLTLKPGERLYGYLQQIGKASERAAGLTHQLLAFSRSQKALPRLLDLNALVLDMDNMLRRLVGENIEMVVFLASSLWPVRADPAQIEQVLMELASNARNAMPSGGRIIIETANAALNDTVHSHPELPAGRYVALSVKDTGVGIPDEIRPHIFEPFFTTKNRDDRSGLGLSICYGIARQIGGLIEADSQEDMGSTFRMYIPAEGAGPQSLQAAGQLHYLPCGFETVLVVEDEPAVRDLAVHVLRGRGYTVIAAPNGVEALKLVHASPGQAIHLLLADVVMPLMGGRELAQELTKAYPDLGILYISGYAAEESGGAAIPSSRAQFMHKPFTPSLLARKVREVLDG